MVLSKHAERRCKNRSISYRVIELIFTYGRHERRNGADVFSMDRAGFEEMMAYEDRAEIRLLAPKLRAYLVVAPGDVLVTAAYSQHRQPPGLRLRRQQSGPPEALGA